VNACIEVIRGALVESRHSVHVAVAHADRGLIASAGHGGYVSYVRSAIKMFQALPLTEDDVVSRLPLTTEELALCTASHNAERFHVETAARILAKLGLTEHALACGPHPPMHVPSALALRARGIRPGRIDNNCSGKHAGMLALARHHGWPVEGYHELDHPVQQRMLATMSAWSDVPPGDIAVGVDGCGLPTFALPLDAVAMACARFATAAAAPSPAGTIVHAMVRHPEYVAGTGRLCTILMQTAAGRLFAKVGAEGYYCAGVPSMRVGIALKVEDGAKRASEAALLTVLHAIGALSAAEHERLREFSQPAVLNTRGEVVGEIRARIALH
jgi:L-asparaginase II